jgi:hypothetical protein
MAMTRIDSRQEGDDMNAELEAVINQKDEMSI